MGRLPKYILKITKRNKLTLANKYMNKRFSGVDKTNYYMKKGTYTKLNQIDQKYLIQENKKIDL